MTLFVKHQKILLHVNACLDTTLQDEFGDNFLDLFLFKGKEACQLLKTEGLVLLGGAEQETEHCSLFKGEAQRLLQVSALKLWDPSDSIDAEDVLDGSLPVRFVQGTGCEHDMVLGLFR